MQLFVNPYQGKQNLFSIDKRTVDEMIRIIEEIIINLAKLAGAGALIGGIIDFFLGNNGQKQLKNKMEILWIRLSYINFLKFANEESNFSYNSMVDFFGDGLLSRKRLKLIFIIFSISWVSLLINYSLAKIINDTIDYLIVKDLRSLIYHIVDVLVFLIQLIIFSMSISITIYISRFIAKTPAMNGVSGLIFLAALILLQYASIAVISIISVKLSSFTLPMIVVGVYDLDFSLYESTLFMLSDLIKNTDIFSYEKYKIDSIYSIVMMPFKFGLTGISRVITDHSLYQSVLFSYIPGIIRLFLFILFIIIWTLHYFQKTILYIWDVFLEKDRPIFSFIFGCLAVIIGIIQTILDAVGGP